MSLKRPTIIHSQAILRESTLGLRLSIGLKNSSPSPKKNNAIPLKNLNQFAKQEFSLELKALDSEGNLLFSNRYITDKFGSLSLSLLEPGPLNRISSLQIYETSYRKDLSLHLGTLIPQKLVHPVKLIISDLDKTLIETQSATPKDIFHSLTRPLTAYPPIEDSIRLIHQYQEQAFSPFILSASPHFYVSSIQNWLLSQKIFNANVFLKDYRHFFSLHEGLLRPKDILNQGLFKLAHLFDILLLTGIPHELVLVGDDSESDPLIYAIICSILDKHLEAHDIWRRIKTHPSFKLQGRQHTYFLEKSDQIHTAMNLAQIQPKTKIYIRKTGKTLPQVSFAPAFIQEMLKLIETY